MRQVLIRISFAKHSNEGDVLTRIWCLYEIWKTFEKKQSYKHLRVLLSSLNAVQAHEILSSFHVDKAKATKLEDLNLILASIEKSHGKQQITESIRQILLESSLMDVEQLSKSNKHNAYLAALI